MAASKKEYETEIKALKETLQAQQELLQKLYIELDAERESSATAASESLSMILRLQEQKALVEMEANHYKRMVEEKMFHTEESLVAVEDLMYQKDMEITCLEYQLEAYKCKLLSFGCNADVGVHDGHIKRNSSLPPIPAITKASYLKRGVEKDFDRDNNDRSPSTLMFNMAVLEDRSNGHYLESEKSYDNSVVGNLESYWEQIRKLDERVKERLDYNKDPDKGSHHQSLNCRSRSSSVSSHMNNDSVAENEPIVITEIQDIFEVPQMDHQESKSDGKRKVTQDEWLSEGEKRLVKPELVVLQDALNQDNTSFVRHTLRSTQSEMFKPSEGHIVKSHIDDSVYKAEIQQLTSRMERLESRAVLRDGISEQRDHELALKEMREQLTLLQSEMRRWRSQNKSPNPPVNDSSLVPVMEAMLYFWM